MTSISASSVRSTPSSVVSRSPSRGAADDQRPSAEAIEIEGVHRLADLEHHVVGDVDDDVDRPHAGRLETLCQPGGEGPIVTSNTCAQYRGQRTSVLETHVDQRRLGEASLAASMSGGRNG